MRLAKRFHFVPEIIDALFFQVIDKHNVGFGNGVGFRESIILPQNGIQHGGFPRTGVPDKDDIQVVNVHQGADNRYGIGSPRFLVAGCEFADIVGFVFRNKGWLWNGFGEHI